MRIVFLNGVFNQMRISMPTGILMLASIVRQAGYDDVYIYDPCINGDDIQTSVTMIGKLNPTILAISVIQPNNDNILEFVKEYKIKYHHTKIVIGGHGPSLQPVFYLSEGVEAIFVGDGELSFLSYLESTQKGHELKNVPGIVYYSQDQTLEKTAPPPPVDDLDSLPIMARDTLPLLIDKYGSKIYVQILSSRGCYMNCSYCSIKTYMSINGNSYRERSVQSVIKEIEYLHERYGVTRFDFIDDNFIPNDKSFARKKISEFCEGIYNLHIPDFNLFMFCRIDNFDPIAFNDLKQLGLRGIFIGIESVHDNDLKLYGKAISSTQIYSTMNELYRLEYSCDINSYYKIKPGLIVFNPYSTKETLQSNLAFIRRYHITPKKYCSILVLSPKTRITQKIMADDLLRGDCSFEFVDKDIATIFAYSKQTLDQIWVYRDRIRLPYKMNLEMNIGSSDKRLNQYRIEFDQICLQAFEEFLNYPLDCYEDIMNQYINLAKDKMNHPDLANILQKAEAQCSIDSNHPSLVIFR